MFKCSVFALTNVGHTHSFPMWKGWIFRLANFEKLYRFNKHCNFFSVQIRQLLYWIPFATLNKVWCFCFESSPCENQWWGKLNSSCQSTDLNNRGEVLQRSYRHICWKTCQYWFCFLISWHNLKSLNRKIVLQYLTYSLTTISYMYFWQTLKKYI